MRLLTRWLARRADATIQRENERLGNAVAPLTDELAAEKSRTKIQQLEIDSLAAVVARYIKRVEAETAAAARQIVDAEH